MDLAQKNVTVAAAAVAAVLAEVPASSWYLGQADRSDACGNRRQNSGDPHLKLVRHDYQRNPFDASEVITIEIPAALFRMPAGQERPGGTTEPQPGTKAPAPQPPLRFTIRTVIQHGPLPGFKTFAAGSASTIVEFG